MAPFATKGTKLFAVKASGIGIFAGALGSLAGMGGGFVMIPLMTSRSLLGLTQHQAHGTSLFAVAATGLAGSLSYIDHVQWETAAAIAFTGMLSARMGAKVTSYLSDRVLKRSLGILMLCMGPAVPLKSYYLSSPNETSGSKQRNLSQDLPGRLAPPLAIGMGSGFLAGMFGVGGGVIVVPAITLSTDCTHYEALATSLAAMTLPAMVGTYTHFRTGNVAMKVAPFLALGALGGSFYAGKVALSIDQESLRWGFSGLLVLLGLRTIAKS